MAEPGHNGADAELKRRASRRVDILSQIADLQADLKVFKAEDKSDGYTEKALAAVVRTILKSDPEAHAEQLAFELELDTYRRACGVQTNLREAQDAVAEAVRALPGESDDDTGRKPKRSGRP